MVKQPRVGSGEGVRGIGLQLLGEVFADEGVGVDREGGRVKGDGGRGVWFAECDQFEALEVFESQAPLGVGQVDNRIG